MKRYDFWKGDWDEIKVICEHDGEEERCGALAVNGLCKCDKYLCRGAVAVVAKKDGRTQYLALED